MTSPYRHVCKFLQRASLSTVVSSAGHRGKKCKKVKLSRLSRQNFCHQTWQMGNHLTHTAQYACPPRRVRAGIFSRRGKQAAGRGGRRSEVTSRIKARRFSVIHLPAHVFAAAACPSSVCARRTEFAQRERLRRAITGRGRHSPRESLDRSLGGGQTGSRLASAASRTGAELQPPRPRAPGGRKRQKPHKQSSMMMMTTTPRRISKALFAEMLKAFSGFTALIFFFVFLLFRGGFEVQPARAKRKPIGYRTRRVLKTSYKVCVPAVGRMDGARLLGGKVKKFSCGAVL